MAEKNASGRITPHQCNGGNAGVAVMRHKITAADAVGDVLRFGQFSIDTEYTDISVRSEGGAGTGVTVDLGISEMETGDVTADKFKAAIDIAAANSRDDDIIVEPVLVENTHELIGTVKAGTLTVGSNIVVIAHYRSNGA